MQAVVAEGSGTSEMLHAVSGYNPFVTVALRSNDATELEKLVPHMKQYGPVEGRAAAYICSPKGCLSPFADPVIAAREIALPP